MIKLSNLQKSCPVQQFAKKVARNDNLQKSCPEWQFAQKLSRTKFAKYLPRTKICNILVGKTNLQKSCWEQQFAKEKLAGIKAYLEIYSVVCFGHPTTDFGSIWFKKRVNFNIFINIKSAYFVFWPPHNLIKILLSNCHTSYLSFFLHRQNFWRIIFTPKNA